MAVRVCAEHEHVGVDRKALARLHSPPDIVFRPPEVPRPAGVSCGEDSTEVASRTAYCEANPATELPHDNTAGGDNLSRLKIVVEDPPAAASNHWHPVPPVFGFQTAVSSTTVQSLLQEQSDAMMQVRQSPSHTPVAFRRRSAGGLSVTASAWHHPSSRSPAPASSFYLLRCAVAGRCEAGGAGDRAQGAPPCAA